MRRQPEAQRDNRAFVSPKHSFFKEQNAKATVALG